MKILMLMTFFGSILRFRYGFGGRGFQSITNSKYREKTAVSLFLSIPWMWLRGVYENLFRAGIKGELAILKVLLIVRRELSKIVPLKKHCICEVDCVWHG